MSVNSTSQIKEVKIIREVEPYKPDHRQIILILIVICLVLLLPLAIILLVIIMVYSAKRTDTPDWFKKGTEIVIQISSVIIPLVTLLFIGITILGFRNKSEKYENLIIFLSMINFLSSMAICLSTIVITVISTFELNIATNWVPFATSFPLVIFSLSASCFSLTERDEEEETIIEVKKE